MNYLIYIYIYIDYIAKCPYDIYDHADATDLQHFCPTGQSHWASHFLHYLHWTVPPTLSYLSCQRMQSGEMDFTVRDSFMMNCGISGTMHLSQHCYVCHVFFGLIWFIWFYLCSYVLFVDFLRCIILFVWFIWKFWNAEPWNPLDCVWGPCRPVHAVAGWCTTRPIHPDTHLQQTTCFIWFCFFNPTSTKIRVCPLVPLIPLILCVFMFLIFLIHGVCLFAIWSIWLIPNPKGQSHAVAKGRQLSMGPCASPEGSWNWSLYSLWSFFHFFKFLKKIKKIKRFKKI